MISCFIPFPDSLQSFSKDIIGSVDVATILPSLMSCGLVTTDEVGYFNDQHVLSPDKQRKLGSIIVTLSEDYVEKFMCCLEETRDYDPHNTLLKKIRDGK